MVLVSIFSDLDSRCLKGVVLFSGRLLYPDTCIYSKRPVESTTLPPDR
jgi:hypothetical protein